MPDFEYIALSEDGKESSGRISAAGAAEARALLRSEGLNVLSMRAGKMHHESAAPQRTGRIRKRDVATAFRQLSILLHGGMALVPALTALSEQLEGTPLGRIFSDMQEQVRTGGSFAGALAGYPSAFPPVFVSIVSAGEAVGALDDVLLRLAEMTERSLEVSGKVRAAMVYPAILLFTGAAVIIFLLTFVVPGITRLFIELEQQLPLPTVILIHVSEFLRSFFWLIAALVAVSVVAYRVALRNDSVRTRTDWLKLHIPVVGPLLLKSALSRFAHTLGVMLKSGVPVLQALENAGRVTANSSLYTRIRKASRQVEEGAGLAAPLGRSGIFPPIVVHMVASGETSGNVEEGLLSVSEIYQTEIENSIRTLTSLVEPLMILLLGIIIGFMVLAVLLPVFEINQMIG